MSSSSSNDPGGEPRGILPPERDYDTKAVADSFSTSDDYEEKTEIIFGDENLIKWNLRTLSTVTKSIDLCGDRFGPSIIIASKQILEKYIELHGKGVKHRVITEITKENIIHCKQLMKFQELRHLDGLKGYLGIADGRVLTSTAFGQESKILPHMVVSNVRFFVEQQQYFFETLWSKAIPAKQRIREIEEGAKREFVETIRDPSEIEKIGFDLIKNAEEEILLLFSKHSAFFLQEKARERVLELLKGAVSPPRNVKIRILIPAAADDDNTDATTTIANDRRIIQQQLKELGIDVRRIPQQHQENFLQNNNNNNLTLLIADQSSYLTVELNDNDTKGETSEQEDAIELATYSNSEATVFAYISIFENLWMQADA